MPLSEHEQRLLDQIERALYQEDPKFASAVRSTDLRTHMRRRLRRAGIVFAIGFAVLFAGVPTQQFAIGVAGFVIMLGGLLIAMTAWKRLGGGPGQAQPDLRLLDETGELRQRPARAKKAKKAKAPRTTGSPLERLEERWKRRWDERGR
ncbi:MAG: DUF3040 domain-containing protein [Mycobacteriales bacterium]|nr:DUF3040 domain-containing protein [Mycobacteriales bacterium]